MTQLDMLRAMVDETDEAVLTAYLHLAGEKITVRCYPFSTGKAVPPKYYALQAEIAAYLINKRGGEGELSHSEAGVSRTYESASVPESMLKDVVPFVGMFGGS